MDEKSRGIAVLISGSVVAAPGALSAECKAQTPCDVPAEVFLDVSPHADLGEPVGLSILGPMGERDFAFTSGTGILSIIAAVNSFTSETGVVASDTHAMRVRLRGVSPDFDPFISAQQISGMEPRLFSASSGGDAQWAVASQGENGLTGDVNCDAAVNVTDLLAVINRWGPCPPVWQTCTGNLDGNNQVNVTDLLIVISNWGATH